MWIDLNLFALFLVLVCIIGAVCIVLAYWQGYRAGHNEGIRGMVKHYKQMKGGGYLEDADAGIDN